MLGLISRFFTDADYFLGVMGRLGGKLPSWAALQRFAIAAFFIAVNQGLIPIPVASDTKAGWYVTIFGALTALLKSSGDPNMTLPEIAERLSTVQGTKLKAVEPPPEPPKPAAGT